MEISKLKIKEGFTLIELLIVIAIIGILATVVLVRLADAREKAKWSNYIAYVSQVTKLVKASVASGSFSSSVTGQGCLGDYHSAGSQCWGGEVNWENGDNTAINGALSSVGVVPKGVQTPNVNNRGTIISAAANSITIYAFVGTGSFSYCEKFGWDIINTVEATPTYRYCRTTIQK